MTLLKFAYASVMLALAAGFLNAGETVSDPRLGLRLTAPDGFMQVPDLVRGDVVYAFQRMSKGEPTFILVRRLGGTLGREKLDPAEASAKGPQVSLTTEKWKEFDIDVIRLSEQMGNLRLVTFNAQVPLKPEAVQVTVSGAAGREDELHGLLRSVLSNLDGQTNWLTSKERWKRFFQGIYELAIAVVVVVVLGGAAWRAIRKRRRVQGGAEAGAAPPGGA
jgi:hypothetical protein